MSTELYSREDILYYLKKYFIDRLDLENNKDDIMVFYNSGFWFSCRKKSTMDKIANIDLSEIYKSCNQVDSDDDSFYDEEDLLEELNLFVKNNDVVDYIKVFLEEVYGATCISE